jgi:hypothetical protein
MISMPEAIPLSGFDITDSGAQRDRRVAMGWLCRPVEAEEGRGSCDGLMR